MKFLMEENIHSNVEWNEKIQKREIFIFDVKFELESLDQIHNKFSFSG